jgi:hypothetical protein
LFGGAEDDAVVARPGWPLQGTPRHVVVANRLLVEDGALLTADLGEIRARAVEQAARLWRRMERLPCPPEKERWT